MGKRERLRAFLAPSATGTRTRSVSPSLGSPVPPPSVRRAASPVHTTTPNPALGKAIELQLQKLPEAGRAAFEQEIKALDEEALLSKVRAYDAEHKHESVFRPHAERLTKTFNLFNRLLGGFGMGIQADPAISAIVVGAVRVVVDLGLQFARFFPRLTDMVCEFEDYLGPLAEHSRAADTQLVEGAIVSVYTDILDFSWKARSVFVDMHGTRWRWTSFRAFMRQHWDTFEAEFVSIKEEMRHHLDVLQHSVQATHYNAFRSAERRKERSNFLAWVSEIDFEEVHQGIYAKKHEGTADWLIREPKFQQWIRNPQSSLLWCNGKPGIGKSVLSSNVLEHITAETGLRKGTAICFAFYDYRNTRLADATQIIAALIKQLCQRQDRIPDSLLQIQRDGRSQSLVGSLDFFLALAENFEEIFIVFDALDECPKENRQAILGFIAEVVATSASCRMKVFSTSRIETDIAEAFSRNRVPTVQILAESVATDIRQFVRSRVEELRAGKHGKVLYVTGDDLAEKIVETLAHKAEGMFLWVNLQLDSLCRASEVRRDQVVETALNSLPDDLPNTYVRILNRIEQQHTSMRDLAFNCLAWTLYARRPLKSRELQCALAVNSNSTLQDLQVDSLEVIIQACGNLLEEANGAIRPIHYTVQEYLVSNSPGMPPHFLRTQLLDWNSVHERLALVCLNYMHLVAFDAPTRGYMDLFWRLQKTHLAGYAYQNFDYHITNCTEVSLGVMNQLEKLLQHGHTYLAAILQIKVLKGGHNYDTVKHRFNRMDFVVTPSTITYSTSLYNVPTVSQRWVDQSPPVYGLHLAASAGLPDAMVRLLNANCDVNQKDSSGNVPLYYACLNDDQDVIKLLIDEGANINTQGGYFGSPLQAASARGHEQVVKILLDSGAEVNTQGGCYSNALHAASARGHEQVVKILLASRAEVNAQGGRYGNALQAASAGGREQVVKILLDSSAEVNAQGGFYGNALQAASAGGREQVVKILLDSSAEVNAQGGFYGTALQAASAGGREQVVKILLDSRAEINAQGGFYGNALQAASAGGHEQVIKMLLKSGAEVHAQNGRYLSATTAAAYHGEVASLNLLLGSGSTQLQDYYGRTLLWWAAAGGKTAMVETLIDQYKIDPERADNFGRRPLWIAVKKGHGAVSRRLPASEEPPVESTPYEKDDDSPYRECDVCTLRIPKMAIQYHCDICIGGDWDMCEDCRNYGASCFRTAHTLVKRTMVDGVWQELTT